MGLSLGSAAPAQPSVDLFGSPLPLAPAQQPAMGGECRSAAGDRVGDGGMLVVVRRGGLFAVVAQMSMVSLVS